MRARFPLDSFRGRNTMEEKKSTQTNKQKKQEKGKLKYKCFMFHERFLT